MIPTQKEKEKQWVDSILGRDQIKPKRKTNVIIDMAWEDLIAGRITPFQYNEKYRNAIKLNNATGIYNNNPR